MSIFEYSPLGFATYVHALWFPTFRFGYTGMTVVLRVRLTAANNQSLSFLIGPPTAGLML
jgi:hypothetical protein